jgi:leader peptidase (prepilin peptidase)/N-methyltransferase
VTTQLLFVLTGLVLGLLFGSFLNVCITRLPRNESIVKPRSRCPHCAAPISWYDNIPLLSWLLLRGHCRDCKAAISWQYPLVELATGLWFALAGSHLAQLFTAPNDIPFNQLAIATTEQIVFVILGFLLIGLMVMDWQTQLLPDAFTFTGIAISFFLTCIQAFFLGPTEGRVILGAHHIRLASPGNVIDHGNVFFTGPENMVNGWLFATAGAAIILLLIRWLYKSIRHREGMGLGDVKLIALIAAFLGFWPAVLSLFLGVILASAYAILLLLRGKAGATTRLAFGSFLCLGGLITALYGSRILETYMSFLR